MHVAAHLDVDLVALEIDDRVAVMLQFDAPQPPATTERRIKHTAIVVLDRSGSMSGDHPVLWTPGDPSMNLQSRGIDRARTYHLVPRLERNPMNEDPSAELSSAEQMAEEEQGVIYTVLNDELFFLDRYRVEQINEVRELLAGGGTYSALIEAIDPLEPMVAYWLERLLEMEEENLEGEDREAGSEKLMFDYAKLDYWLDVEGKILFEDNNSELPEEIVKRFGQRIVGDSPLWSGEYLGYPAAEEAAIVQALRERGVSATRDDSTVMSCLFGYPP